MGFLLVNIRFLYWHLQIGKRFKSFSFRRNTNIYSLKGLKKIQVFKFFNYNYLIKKQNGNN